MRALIKHCEDPSKSQFDTTGLSPPAKHLLDRLQNHAIHIRRSLDQSFYWSLPNSDYRDNDQVVDRYVDKVAARQSSAPTTSSADDGKGPNNNLRRGLFEHTRQPRSSQHRTATARQSQTKHRHLLMVDQLWMWVMNEGGTNSMFTVKLRTAVEVD